MNSQTRELVEIRGMQDLDEFIFTSFRNFLRNFDIELETSVRYDGDLHDLR